MLLNQPTDRLVEGATEWTLVVGKHHDDYWRGGRTDAIARARESLGIVHLTSDGIRPWSFISTDLSTDDESCKPDRANS